MQYYLRYWLDWKFMEVSWCSMVYVWYCFSSETSLRRYWLINRKHLQVWISFWWVICIKWLKSLVFLPYHWFWFLWLLLIQFYMMTEWMNKVLFFKECFHLHLIEPHPTSSSSKYTNTETNINNTSFLATQAKLM